MGKGKVRNESILALTGGFVLFLALFAGPFSTLAFTNLGLLLAFTNLGLLLAFTVLGHCYPSPRSFTPCQQPTIRTYGKS